MGCCDFFGVEMEMEMGDGGWRINEKADEELFMAMVGSLIVDC